MLYPKDLYNIIYNNLMLDLDRDYYVKLMLKLFIKVSTYENV